MSFTQQNGNGVIFHTADAFTAAGGVVHGFATRLGGVSQGPYSALNLGIKRDDSRENVRENYRRFCAAIGADQDSLVMTHQVHQDNIRTARRADVLEDLLDPIPYETDALITDEPGLCLTIYYADCIPVLLYDPRRRCVAAIHSGWRGTALGIVPQAVERLSADYGSDPGDILAAIGPGIGPCCFETHEDVPSALLARWGQGAEPFCRPLPEKAGKFTVDLKGLLAWQLRQAGVEQVDTLPLCTGCHPELYWSHRKLGDRRGNQAAMIQLG